MDYLLKASAIIVLFYLCYKLLLQRETFFTSNRWFLLIGLFIASILPTIVIPIYIETTPQVFDGHYNTIIESTPMQYIETPFDWLQLIVWVYSAGVIFFLGRLLVEFLSLLRLFKSHKRKTIGKFTFIETTDKVAPFSFFNWIVYNPDLFTNEELQVIIKHEQVHASQFHSLDMLVSHISTVVFWFNPFMWLYKKELQQNLEFIADQTAQNQSDCKKSYQKLLLKTSIQQQQLMLTNNFYNSLIKKRIVMLHTSKSNKMNAFKYVLIIPLLALFVFNFNTEVIAQTKEVSKIGQNVLKFVITKDTKDKQLESIKEKLAEKDITIDYKDMVRNEQKEITGIRIEYDSNKGSGQFFVNSDEPIKDIEIALNINEDRLSVGQAIKNLSQSFEILTDDDGNKKVKTSGTGSNVFVYSTDDDDNDETITVVGKDGETHEVKKEKQVYVIKSSTQKDSNEADDDVVFMKKNKRDTVWIKKDVKNIVWTDDDGKDVEIIAVENGNNKNYNIFTNGDENPIIFLNGKQISNSEMSDIKTDKILRVDVLKDDDAIKKYGKKGKNGVIYIVMKDDASLNGVNQTIVIGEETIVTKKEPTYVMGYNSDSIEEINVSYTISKSSTNLLMETFKSSLKKAGVDAVFSKIKRNKNGEITSIKISLEDTDGHKSSETWKSDNVTIPNIAFGKKGAKLFIKSIEK